MKKVLFSFILFFVSFGVVCAESFYFDSIYSKKIDLDKVYTNNVDIRHNAGSYTYDVFMVYYDKEGNLLEAFAMPWNSNRTFSKEAYRTSYYVGNSCSNFYGSDLISMCDINQYGIYFSDNSIDEIKYWRIKAYGVDESFSRYEGTESIFSFCSNVKEVQNSKICSDLIFKSIVNFSGDYGILVFQEYEPATFELICEPEKVKKGETSDCKLKIRATEEITKLVIPVNSDLFEIIKFDEVDSWKLTDNNDGTVTLVPDLAFKGAGVVLNGTFKFKEDLIDDVNVELNDIFYTTGDGIELEGSAGDSVNIYEEVVEEDTKIEEDKKEEIKNPDTVDLLDIVLLCILLTVLVLFMSFRIKKELR